MRVAALYDIHGNLHALDAVLADVAHEAVDAVVVGGDVAGGPMPADVLERLAALDVAAHWIEGNGEREMLALEGADPAGLDPYPAIEAWAVARLDDAQKECLRGLPPTATLDVDGLGRVLFCHGSPRSDEEFITPFTPDERLAEMLAGVEEQTVVGGHTHRQLDRTVGGVRVVNAGSIGMPYEGQVAAFWALLEDGEPRFRKTPFDVERAVAALEASDWSGAAEFVAENMRAAVTREEAIAHFESRRG